MVLMVLLKVLLDLVVGISARDVSDHQVGSGFFSSEDLFKVNWPSIVLTQV